MNFYEVNTPQTEILTNIVREQRERFNYILDVEWKRLVRFRNYNIVVPYSSDLLETLRSIFCAVYDAHEKIWASIEDGQTLTIVGLDLNDLINEFIPIGDLVEAGQIGGYEWWTDCMTFAMTEAFNHRLRKEKVDLEVFYTLREDDNDEVPNTLLGDYVACLCYTPSVASAKPTNDD